MDRFHSDRAARHPAPSCLWQRSPGWRTTLRIVGTLLLWSCFCWTNPLLAQDGGAAEELLHKCGMLAQLDGVAGRVRASVTQAVSAAARKPDPAQVERLLVAVQSAYAPARLRAAALRVVSAGLAADDVEELRGWYESSVGTAIVKAEAESDAASRDPLETAAQGAAVLSGSSARRLQLLQDIVRDSRVAEAGVEMTLDIAVATRRGVEAAMPDAPGIGATELRAAIDSQRLQLLEFYTRLATAGFALSYKSIDDAGLERYVAFLRSRAGQHFNALGLAAITGALSESAEELGRSVSAVRSSATT